MPKETEEDERKNMRMGLEVFTPLLMGKNCGAIDDIKPAAEIIDEMVSGALTCLRGATCATSAPRSRCTCPTCRGWRCNPHEHF